MKGDEAIAEGKSSQEPQIVRTLHTTYQENRQGYVYRKVLTECGCDVVSHRTYGGAAAAEGKAGCASLHCVHLW